MNGASVPAQLGLPTLSTVLTLLVVATVLGSLLAVRHIDGLQGTVGRRLRARLLMGVPWGTLVVVAGVLAVYLFLQDGVTHWNRPVVVPYRAWSFLYPTGILASGFSHNGPGHLIGNLIGTVVLAPICEYAWGHFPRERGSASFGTPLTNPYVRAFVVFPAASIAAGLATGLFALGPVIGFSGVVFAYAGFGVVTRPVTTLVASLGVTSAVRLTYASLRTPVFSVSPSASPPSPPWWAEVAIQGHALGLLLGIVAAAALLYRRDERPSAALIWLAVLLLAVEQNLWAIYWFLGGDEYVLFRGPGVVAVVLLATLVAVSVSTSLRERWTNPMGWIGLGEDAVSSRTVGFVVLLLVFAPIAGIGLAANGFAASPSEPPDDATTVESRDYDVYYAEDVENEMVAIVDAEFAGLTTNVTTSGVIVASNDRHIWTQAVSKGELAFLGTTRVTVGGPGWREEVRVRRAGWNAVGGGTAYKVFLKPEDESERLAYTSESATADSRVEGYNLSVVPRSDGGFAIAVSRNGSVLSAASMPEDGGNVTVEGITFEREGRTVYATTENGTRVAVFRKERYRNA